MSDPNQPTTPPGWYPDGQGGQRWWDGTAWTEHTMPMAPEATPEPVPEPEPQPEPHPEPEQPVLPPSAEQTQIAPQGFRPGGSGAGYAAPQPGTPAAPQQPSWQQPAQPVQQPSWQQPAQPAQQPSWQQPGASAQGGAPSWQQPGQQAGWQQPPSPASGKGKKIAIFGGAAAVVVILLVVLFAVVLGGGGGPDGVAKSYIQATLDSDVNEVCELSTSSDRDDLFETFDVKECGDLQAALDKQNEDYADEYGDEFTTSIEQQKQLIKDTDFDVEITDSEESSDTRATVDYTIKATYNGDDQDAFDELFDNETSDKGTIVLKKEDGDWRVDQGASDL